jgi:LysR family transcriptional regulator of gallate degradation
MTKSAAAESVRANPPASIEPNLRRLRAYLAVYECGGVPRAAKRLHLSQSSITRTVRELEHELGVALFERIHRGMLPTAFGVILAARAQRALSHLDAAERELLAAARHADAVGLSHGFSGKVTHRQLSALIGIADYQTETDAAQRLDLSQPAVTLALRDLEHLVGEPLFLRTARGMVATVSGEILSRRAKLAFSEINAACSDIAARVGVLTGRVVVGVLALSGALLTPRAINLLLTEHPNLQVNVVDATYQSLIQGLLCGDIDVIVGGLDYSSPSEIVQEVLFQDQLTIVSRKGHPLAAKKALSLSDLADVDWVVPRRGTPARINFERAVKQAGLQIGGNCIESNALPPVRALVMESDRVAVISRHQIHFEETAGLLVVLPIDLQATALPVGFRTRADAAPSAGVKALVHYLRKVSAELPIRISRSSK